MSDYLPPELWSYIFRFLPVKSLLRCTAVCTRWRSTITSPSFIADHLSLARQNPLLLTNRPGTHHTLTFSLNYDTDPPLLSRIFHCPFSNPDIYLHFRLVGSVHGLICLSNEPLGPTRVTVIWNPSIRKHIELPMPSFTSDETGPCDIHMGFGFDSIKNEYKVVRIVYIWGSRMIGQLPPLVEVFSLRERSWRPVIADNVDYYVGEHELSKCFIHGAVHWIAFRPSENLVLGCNLVVLVFDVEKEVFKKMKLPECLSNVDEFHKVSISVIGGLLSVLDQGSEPIPGYREGKGEIDIWVKREYGVVDSWTKMFTLDNKWEVGVALHLRRIGSEFLSETSGEDSGEVDYGCKDLQIVTRYQIVNDKPFYALSYPESLVLLDKESGAVWDGEVGDMNFTSGFQFQKLKLC